MSSKSTPVKKINILPWIISVVLLLGLIAATSFAYSFQADLVSVSEELKEAEEHKENILADFDICTSELEKSQDASSALNTKLEETNTDLEIKQSELGTLRTKYNTMSTELNKANKQLDILICDKTIKNMNYEEILTSSNKLAAYLTDLDWIERTSYTFRNTLWDNALSKVHGVHYIDKEDGEVYSTQFMVYYDEFGWEPSTFWIDNQCWIDPPNNARN